MMQISAKALGKFAELLSELVRAYKLWSDDHTKYYQEIKKDNLIVTGIDAPCDLAKEIRRKWESHEPCIFQLRRTARSIELTWELAELIYKSNSTNCLVSELTPILEAIAYEYVNTDLDGFVNSIGLDGKTYQVSDDIMKNIAHRRLSEFKRGFSPFVFQFPLIVFNLERELRLSKSIRLVPIDSSDLTEKEFESYKFTRTCESNFYLEIYVQNRCSQKLALQLAERARDVAYNLLKLLATNMSSWAVPLLASNDRNSHLFDFYRYGSDLNRLDTVTIRKFQILHSDSKHFWDAFYEGKTLENNVIGIVFEIAEILLRPNFSGERVADRLERALIWYGDAVTEPNFYQQLQKLVSAIEALVNLGEKVDVTEVNSEEKVGVTEIFKRRVTHLNITRTGLDEKVRERAGQVYDARSKIVHGSSIHERLSFCAVDFCSETLVRGIYYFSLFGFEKIGFKKELAKFMDDLPEHAVLQKD